MLSQKYDFVHGRHYDFNTDTKNPRLALAIRENTAFYTQTKATMRLKRRRARPQHTGKEHAPPRELKVERRLWTRAEVEDAKETLESLLKEDEVEGMIEAFVEDGVMENEEDGETDGVDGAGADVEA